jgi:aspartyl-tRNA(Asn)/glutamyl-tRNA(Gln) amidotransferase subunit C
MISKEDTKQIAKLARLGLSEKEVEKFQKDLSSILDYFETLKQVNVSGVEPTFHSSEKYIDNKSIMREDQAESESEQVIDKLIKAAPDKKERHIKVKAVFD